MEDLYIIIPSEDIPVELNNMISSFTKHSPIYRIIKAVKDSDDYKGKKLLFVLNIGNIGFDIGMLDFLSKLKEKHSDAFQNSTGAVISYSKTEFGTKCSAQDIIFLANNMGCAFIGHPLVEATKDMRNFLTWQKSIDLPLVEICYELSSRLGRRLMGYEHKKIADPKITVLYSTPHKFSNTLNLWRMVSDNLKDYNINEILIENGKILDCKGCSYKLCLHYAKKNTCFYGGFMVENILPAIEESDCVVWLCPNYNDGLSANLTATINRLTVFCHKHSFYNKSMFGVVVSGNSGSDAVAKQLLGALNINKGFRLPAYAIVSETANDPKSVLKIKDIHNKVKCFTDNFKEEFEIKR